MKASDLLVQCLENEGIEYIFGVPGEENADFMLSLEKSKKIRFILTRHSGESSSTTGSSSTCLGPRSSAAKAVSSWLTVPSRSGERRVGHECVSPYRSRWSTYN